MWTGYPAFTPLRNSIANVGQNNEAYIGCQYVQVHHRKPLIRIAQSMLLFSS
jgi:hypothetical protein